MGEAAGAAAAEGQADAACAPAGRPRAVGEGQVAGLADAHDDEVAGVEQALGHAAGVVDGDRRNSALRLSADSRCRDRRSACRGADWRCRVEVLKRIG